MDRRERLLEEGNTPIPTTTTAIHVLSKKFYTGCSKHSSDLDHQSLEEHRGLIWIFNTNVLDGSSLQCGAEDCVNGGILRLIYLARNDYVSASNYLLLPHLVGFQK